MKKIILLFLVILGVSCDHDDESEFLKQKQQNTGELRLGEKLHNPYSVENMKEALRLLIEEEGLVFPKSGGTNLFEIGTTHKYIKFIPKSEEELTELKKDTVLDLYPYPLDYELIGDGDDYRDPEVPEDQPTYQYASVPVDHELPKSIKWENITDLFVIDEGEIEIPEEWEEMAENEDEDNEIQAKSFSNNNEITLALLNAKALEITGNIDNKDKDEEVQAKGWFRRLRRRFISFHRKWRPSGRITMYDQDLGKTIGIPGLKVKARRWFTTRRGYTNTNGYFSVNGQFRGHVRYSYEYERYHFQVKSEWRSYNITRWFQTAKVRGPYWRNKAWNHHITAGRDLFHAIIYRAAYHYYYENIQGLRRPPLRKWWKPQLKIRADYKNNKGNINGDFSHHLHLLRFTSAIRIYNSQRSPKHIYATTIHELAHASHWNMDNSVFWRTDTKLSESWASGVQWLLTKMVYNGYDRPSYHSFYTAYFRDLIDPKDKYNFQYDQVEGYTPRQLEDALNRESKWGNITGKIKRMYNNPTENEIYKVFDRWDKL